MELHGVDDVLEIQWVFVGVGVGVGVVNGGLLQPEVRPPLLQRRRRRRR